MAYEPSEGLRLRFGKMLAPYGIYNEIHDKTPLFHSPFLPSVIYGEHSPIAALDAARFYSKFATGIAADLIRRGALGEVALDVMLSNGRGASPGEMDDNANKALNVKAVYTEPENRLRAGMSYDRSRNGRQEHSLQTSVAYDLTLGLSGIDRGLVLIAEASFSQLDPRDVALTDIDHVAGYVDLLYYGELGLIPWIRIEGMDMNRDSKGDEISIATGGVAWETTENVTLKASISWGDLGVGPAPYRRQFVASASVRF